MVALQKMQLRVVGISVAPGWVFGDIFTLLIFDRAMKDQNLFSH